MFQRDAVENGGRGNLGASLERTRHRTARTYTRLCVCRDACAITRISLSLSEPRKQSLYEPLRYAGQFPLQPGPHARFHLYSGLSADSTMSASSYRYTVLVVGSGAREHALVWRLSLSPMVARICVAPGNGGTRLLASTSKTVIEHVPFSSNRDLCTLAVKEKIGTEAAFSPQIPARLFLTSLPSVAVCLDVVVVGPEAPLAEGLADDLADVGIKCFGPKKRAAEIEASKAFAKAFMQRHGIPTAKYETFSSVSAAHAYIDQICGAESGANHQRVVVKASGLAAGKGVILPLSKTEAKTAVTEMLEKKLFGEAGAEVVIEEYLEGEEASVLAFTDGETIIALPAAQDHKRALNGNRGLNTGGMGAFAPTPLVTESLKKQIMQKVLQPAVSGLAKEGTPFVGCLFAGLMFTPDQGIRVLEYNCRMGDPETQVVLPLLKTDLLHVILACVNGTLKDLPIEIHQNASCVIVVAAAHGYPETYRKGDVITGLERTQSLLSSFSSAHPTSEIFVFHAGTKLDPSNGHLETCGGRVLSVTAKASSLREAVALSYRAMSNIHFEQMHFRTDIAIHKLDKLRIAVLGSTRGTDLQAIIDAIEDGSLYVDLKLVVSNKEDAYILTRAAKYNPVFVPSAKRSRTEFEADVCDEIEKVGGVDLILCIGFMRILSPSFVQRYAYRILNVHPSLLPDFAGGMDLDVHSEVLKAGKKVSGCTVHIIDANVDTGPIVVQRKCEIVAGETSESLKAKVQALEQLALLEAIYMYQQGRLPYEMMTKKGVTYSESGVDTAKGDSLVERIKPVCKATKRPGADASLGGFGGLFDMAAAGYKDPVLVSGTDGVGTKLLVAIEFNKHDTVGQDLVAMCVNDILAQGAEPLFFLDYFASSNLSVDQAATIITGIAEACKASGCALIGGETAEMPGLYRHGDYDLAGFAVGAVERTSILPRLDLIGAEDVVIGLTSSGLHSNGFSLVRHLITLNHVAMNERPPFPSPHAHLYDELLQPTVLYIASVLPLIKKGLIKSIAHITGGGLVENIPRALPPHVTAHLDAHSWTVPPIFKWLAKIGSMETAEVLKTWNVGIGLVLVVSKENVKAILEALAPFSSITKSSVVGTITPLHSSGKQVVIDNIDSALL